MGAYIPVIFRTPWRISRRREKRLDLSTGPGITPKNAGSVGGLPFAGEDVTGAGKGKRIIIFVPDTSIFLKIVILS